MNKRYLLIAFVLFMGFIASCKKDQKSNLPVVEVNAQDSGKPRSISQGQSLKVTLANPGDGGYSFNDPQYDPSVLKLNTHTHTDGNVNAVGDFGSDTWTFSAVKHGSATVTITATRATETPIVLFTATVTVK